MSIYWLLLNSGVDRVALLGDSSVLLPAGRFIIFWFFIVIFYFYMCGRLFSFVLYKVFFVTKCVFRFKNIFFAAHLFPFAFYQFVISCQQTIKFKQ